MKQFFCLIIAVAVLLCGCTAGEPGREASALFTDDLGREVSLPEEPKRVACLLGSFADVWMNAGGTVIAAPDDAWEDFGLEMQPDATVLGSAKSLNLELLLAAEPDLILASANTRQQLQWQDTLEATGIPTVYFHVSDFGDYLRLLEFCTAITGRTDLYEQYGTHIQAQIDETIAQSHQRIEEAGKAPTVLCLRLAASGIRVKNSRDNVLGEMLSSLGCVNIADSDTVLLENVSMEHILLADPDFIFLVQQGDDTEGTQAVLDAFIADNPGWQSLTAVQEGRVFTLDKRRYSLKPNALWAEAYSDLRMLIWP